MTRHGSLVLLLLLGSFPWIAQASKDMSKFDPSIGGCDVSYQLALQAESAAVSASVRQQIGSSGCWVSMIEYLLYTIEATKSGLYVGTGLPELAEGTTWIHALSAIADNGPVPLTAAWASGFYANFGKAGLDAWRLSHGGELAPELQAVSEPGYADGCDAICQYFNILSKEPGGLAEKVAYYLDSGGEIGKYRLIGLGPAAWDLAYQYASAPWPSTPEEKKDAEVRRYVVLHVLRSVGDNRYMQLDMSGVDPKVARAHRVLLQTRPFRASQLDLWSTRAALFSEVIMQRRR